MNILGSIMLLLGALVIWGLLAYALPGLTIGLTLIFIGSALYNYE